MIILNIFLLIILFLLFILSISFFIYFIYNIKNKKQKTLTKQEQKNLIIFFIFSLLISVVISLLSYSIYLIILSVIIAILSYIATFYYSEKSNIFIYIFIALIFTLFYLFFINSLILFLQIFPVITILGFIRTNIDYKKHMQKQKIEKDQNNKFIKIELNRDLFQIILGLFFILIFIFIKNPALLITLIVLFGYLLINLISNDFKINNSIMAKFKQMERINIIYGSGAIYLLCSLLLILGFINNNKFIILGLITIFFADAMATIIGISCNRLNKIKLFYNKNKTLIGSISFFAVLSLFSFILNFNLFLGLIMSLILTFIESLKFEDNITLPISIIILSFII
ncbi:MAG: hypothetical protein M1168_01995 [Candidatus Marsarchaeota archaeon]|nr:hypothetical protein [Candidatus Marsarchaeota archaeon]MCL5094732.1 hypothetical protein [Candidatus Marsarchaeota archaeon]